MAKVVAILVLVLLVLHQDNWFWEDGALVFGFMPIALFYHACISLGAAFVWYLATKFAWPHEIIEAVHAEAASEESRA